MTVEFKLLHLSFSSTSNLKCLHIFLQQLFLPHDEFIRFEWKSLQNDDVTLLWEMFC